jgi:2'-5' RNA ligase
MNAGGLPHGWHGSPRSFVIVAPLDEMPLDSEFRTDAWPLHVTLVPPFQTTKTLTEVVDLMGSARRGIPPMTVPAATRERFGRRHDVRVTTLQSHPALHRLHTALLDAIEPAASGLADRRHVREGYRPHVAVQSGREIVPGESVVIDRMALVDCRPDGRTGLRRVVALVALRG